MCVCVCVCACVCLCVCVCVLVCAHDQSAKIGNFCASVGGGGCVCVCVCLCLSVCVFGGPYALRASSHTRANLCTTCTHTHSYAHAKTYTGYRSVQLRNAYGEVCMQSYLLVHIALEDVELKPSNVEVCGLSVGG